MKDLSCKKRNTYDRVLHELKRVESELYEVTLIHEVLTEIGVEREQFEFAITSYFNISNVSSYLQEKALNENTITETSYRISRGDNNVNTAEIGIRINQKSGGKLGDGRDTHRLMLIVSAMITLSN